MQDRVPTPGQEGRVKITPESGDPFYAKLEMADNPTQVGDALNKANLLSDTTAAKYFASVTGVETVNHVLSKLAAAALKDGTAIKDALGNLITLPSVQLDSRVQIATGSYTGTGTRGSSNKNIVTANFKIKLAIIGSGQNASILFWHTGVTETSRGLISGQDDYLTMSISADEKTLAWYSKTNARSQLNESETSYPYILIGV